MDGWKDTHPPRLIGTILLCEACNGNVEELTPDGTHGEGFFLDWYQLGRPIDSSKLSICFYEVGVARTLTYIESWS